MAGGGGVPSPCAQARSGGGRRRRHQAASLPLDVIAEIAARSDPATLVRCAATCADLRARVADPGFRRRLRLRHAADDRFVPSLLRGHLAGAGDERMYLVDATTPTLLPAAESFPPGPDGEPLKLHKPVSAREGLVLVHRDHELRVCSLATGRSHAVPHGPGEFANSHIHHVLLVGDGGGAVGRPFQVVKASLVFEDRNRRLQVQTFSSELGTWGPCTEIRTPQIHGQVEDEYVASNHYQRRRADPLRTRPLVAGGAVHWLCLTDEAGYVLKLRFRAAAAPRLTVTKLPDSCPYNYKRQGQGRHLLATMAPGGSPAVLVADGKKISAWTQSKHTARWCQQPEVVIRYEAMSRLLGDVGDRMMIAWGRQRKGSLEWFAERSGIVLIRMYDEYLFWLDLQSMEIVRWSEDIQICRNKTIYQPCEMDLSNWAPTFSSSL